MATDEVRAGNWGAESSGSVLKRTRGCLECRSDYSVNPHHAEGHRFCSADCRARWHRGHPGLRAVDLPPLEPQQVRLDWTPTASAVQHAAGKRESKAQAILARLRQGPADTWELARVTHRFAARLQDLEELGMRYERTDHVENGQEWSTYTMTQEPEL